MMPVIDTMQRRAKLGSGRRSTLVDQIQALYFDANNSARNRRFPLLGACFSCGDANKSSSFEDPDPAIVSVEEKKEPGCCTKTIKVIACRRDVAYRVKAGVYIDIVEGRFVVTNISDLLFQVPKGSEKPISKRVSRTPPFYKDSNVYFNDIARSRKQVLDAMGRIGFLIDNGQLEGIPAEKFAELEADCCYQLGQLCAKLGTCIAGFCSDMFSFFAENP